MPKSANALRHWRAPAQWQGREVPRARKEKKATQVLRVLPDHRGNVVSLALKGCREQREKKGIQVLKAPQVYRAKEDSRVLKGRKGQKVKKGIQVLRVLPGHKGNVVSLALKGCRGLQGQREIPQIPQIENRLSELEKRFATPS